MWIRCPNCGWSTRAAFDIERGVTCISCGRFSPLDKAKKLGATPQERFQRAFGFARVHRIDLASSYSILLGIIPFSKALSIPASYNFDPGYRDAVERGFLTPQQASERGDRVLYATTLALNHGLEMKTAFLIADNRMQLDEALEGQIEPDLPDISEKPETRRLWGALEIVGAVAMVGVTMLAIIPSRSTPPTRANVAAPTGSSPAVTTAMAGDVPALSTSAPKHSKVVFRTDPAGRVIEASGPDPKIVLSELCAHEQFIHDLSPIALAPAVPASPGTRLGLVRDMRDLSATKCVAIHRNPRDGRWIVGDGRRPIDTQVAPYFPPGTSITPM